MVKSCIDCPGLGWFLMARQSRQSPAGAAVVALIYAADHGTMLGLSVLNVAGGRWLLLAESPQSDCDVCTSFTISTGVAQMLHRCCTEVARRC